MDKLWQGKLCSYSIKYELWFICLSIDCSYLISLSYQLYLIGFSLLFLFWVHSYYSDITALAKDRVYAHVQLDKMSIQQVILNHSLLFLLNELPGNRASTSCAQFFKLAECQIVFETRSWKKLLDGICDSISNDHNLPIWQPLVAHVHLFEVAWPHDRGTS